MKQKNDKTFGERLQEYLLERETAAGHLDGTLPASPDIDETWVRLGPSLCGDAVREFNNYPEYCLACAACLGMAVAHLWDRDWAVFMNVPYSFFLGKRGFDDMDDHIAGTILKESGLSVSAMQSLSFAAWHFLMREAPEPGTAEAYRMFLAAMEAMYKTGAAIELHRLGYRYEKLGTD